MWSCLRFFFLARRVWPCQSFYTREHKLVVWSDLVLILCLDFSCLSITCAHVITSIWSLEYLNLKYWFLGKPLKLKHLLWGTTAFLGVQFTHCLLLPKSFGFFLCISQRMTVPWAGMGFVSCSQHMVIARQVGQFALMESDSGCWEHLRVHFIFKELARKQRV